LSRQRSRISVARSTSRVADARASHDLTGSMARRLAKLP
jgi:hypothetical protein